MRNIINYNMQKTNLRNSSFEKMTKKLFHVQRIFLQIYQSVGITVATEL